MSGIQAGELQVYAAPLPFSNKRTSHIARAGQSLAEILAEIVPNMHPQLGAVIMVDGRPVRRSEWATTCPAYGALVNIRIVPQGGGGKKNPLASLLSIAVMIGAPYLSGAILGPTLASTTVLGSLTYGQLLGGVIGMVGRLAISALVPPPKQSNNGSGNVSNAAESPTQFIEGARNSLDPFGVVPICLGTNRMFPVQAARPYTETSGADQYVRQLFTYGYGEKLLLSDIKIGETSIAEFDAVQMEHKLEGDLHVSTGLYSNDVYQEDYSVLLNQVDGYTTRTTQLGVDEATVDFTFTQGLAQFSPEGQRLAYTVEIELQFAESGISPQVWSPATSGFTSFAGTTLTVPTFQPSNQLQYDGGSAYVGWRRDMAVINKYTGTISLVQGTGIELTAAAATVGTVPANSVRLATVLMKARRPANSSTVTLTMESLSDDRQASDFGTTLQNSSSFVPSQSGTNIAVSSGGIQINDLRITGAQTEALRVSKNIVFPANGQYDIRARRITADTSSDQILDKCYLSAIKSVTHVAPVNLEGINGTAVRIKGTDQLNGALDQFNALVTNVIPDYQADTDTWVDGPTSNPAAIYRYVMQGAANAKALPDSKLNLDDIQAWHIYCTERGYTYNRVIDYETSVDEVLRDVAAAGAATPAIVDGKRTIVVDREKDDVVQIVTPRNSWDYRGELSYPDLPHAFRVEFRNAAKGYQTDERIVYADGYNASNSTVFERLEYTSCTNSDLAYKHGRRYLATIALRPEIHTFMMDVENLVFNRGDRIRFAHDIPIIGVGDGRITAVTTDVADSIGLEGGGSILLESGGKILLEGGGTGDVTGFAIDDTVDMESGKTYYARIRMADGTQLYKELVTVAGANTSFTFAVPFAAADSPDIGDLCYFVEAGGELDLVVSRIEPQDDLTARITAVDYAPGIFDADLEAIPIFESHISTPLQLLRPDAPLLTDIQSDESVMLLNSDGSYTPRIVISLRNTNEGDVIPVIQYRQSGTTQFLAANTLLASPTSVILSGFDDGTRYDIQIRYKRSGSAGALSTPLPINGYKFVGLSGAPSDVTGFTINVIGDQANYKWDKSADIDASHYHMKLSRLFTGATWETAQTVDDHINETQFSAVFQPGTVFIKAVDRLGNESENAAVIITYDPGVLRNVVETLDETSGSPIFAGTKDNVTTSGTALILSDVYADGYYYFSRTIDLGDVYSSYLSASIIAGGAYTNDVYSMTDVFAVSDIYGGGSNNIFDMDDVYAEDDIFGIGLDSWMVELQYRSTEGSTGVSPVAWSDWQPFVAGLYGFRGIQFRLLLRSLSPVTGITPSVTGLEVVIDMPDRIERGEDLTVTSGGYTVTFDPPFAANPSVAITLQDAATDDRIEFTAKSSSSFTFKVYNATAAGYVTRTFDHITSGYGRG